jgi:hypothetical protein
MRTRTEATRSLAERIALQERVAQRAAEIAEEAERLGQTDSANLLWMLVRRSRIAALKLRARMAHPDGL